jgi:hypothetical protein
MAGTGLILRRTSLNAAVVCGFGDVHNCHWGVDLPVWIIMQLSVVQHTVSVDRPRTLASTRRPGSRSDSATRCFIWALRHLMYQTHGIALMHHRADPNSGKRRIATRASLCPIFSRVCFSALHHPSNANPRLACLSSLIRSGRRLISPNQTFKNV